MRLPALLHRFASAAILALGACTGSTPPSAPIDADSMMPEPVHPSASAARPSAFTGLTLAVAGGATELYVIDAARVQITNAYGIEGGADADAAAAEAMLRGVLADLRFWAEDGALIVDGPAPFAGRARAQTGAGALRVSLATRTAGASVQSGLTAQVRGEEIVGRVTLRSAAGGTHGAFFRAPLRPVQPRDWPPRAPRTLSAERLADGGVLLRWTLPRHAPPDAEHVVYLVDDPSRPAIQVGVTRKTHFAAAAARAGGGGASWYVITRGASGALSSPSPSATLP